MTNKESIQNKSYESKLKELIKEKIYYNFSLKKGQTDEDLKNKFANQILEGIKPKYYEYLYDLIKSRINKFRVTSNDGGCYVMRDFGCCNDKRDLRIGVKCHGDTLAHELGHVADNFMPSNNDKDIKCYSFMRLEGDSLDETLHEEVSLVCPSIYKSMHDFLASSLEEEMGAYAIEYLEYIRGLEKIYRNANERFMHAKFKYYVCKNKRYNKSLDHLGFLCDGVVKTVESKEFKKFIKDYKSSNSYKELLKRYGDIVGDMLLSMYDLSAYKIPGHNIRYFKRPHNLGLEFFAEFFADTLVGNEDNLQLAKKYFPRSYRKAEIVFNKIMGNKNELLLK